VLLLYNKTIKNVEMKKKSELQLREQKNDKSFANRDSSQSPPLAVTKAAKSPLADMQTFPCHLLRQVSLEGNHCNDFWKWCGCEYFYLF
jgi:hypothetical protein